MISLKMRNGIGKTIIFAVLFVVTFSLIFQSNMNGSVMAYNERTYQQSLQLRHDSASSQLDSLQDDNTGDGTIKTVKIIDYVEKVPPSNDQSGGKSVPLILPFGPADQKFRAQATDPCGSGSNQYALLAGGVRWKKFPVKYYVDPSGIASATLKANSIKGEVKRAFDRYDGNVPYTFFAQTNVPSTAKIKVSWKYIDGPLNKAGITTFSYNTATKELVSANIVLDRGDKWFISSVYRCGGLGSAMDIMNIVMHELGHGVGLGHVSDKLLTMYPTAKAGETLKRILGNGDKKAVAFLY